MGKQICGDEEGLLLLDDDLIQEILMRLPVVTLLRFKTVCKSWCALIESSFFIHLHTANTFNSSATSSNKFGSFILHAAVFKNAVIRSAVNVYSFPPKTENALIMLSSESSGSGGFCRWSTDTDDHVWFPPWSDDQVFKVDNNNSNNNNLGGGGGGEGGGSSNDQQLVLKLDSLGFPSCYKSSEPPQVSVIGSCNGLICLADRNILDGNIFDRKSMDIVSLWNPATRQFKILPMPKHIIIEYGDAQLIENAAVDDYVYLLAFGFDLKTKDYKVMLITGFKPRRWPCGAVVPMEMECPCRVQVYSLSTDSWRLLEGITSLPGYPFFDTIQGHYLNGSCFFMARFFYSEQQMFFPKNDRFIISFDFTKEIITTIQIPDHDRNQKLYLSYLGDKMALFTVCSPYDTFDGINYNESEVYDIWVLNEHGRSSSSVNKESWTKLHSFQIEVKSLHERNIPKGISNDGEFALLGTLSISGSSKKMKLYNLATKEVKKNFLCCHGVMSKAADVYKPSLVSITGGNGRSSSSR